MFADKVAVRQVPQLGGLVIGTSSSLRAAAFVPGRGRVECGRVASQGWTWDESLYAGSASHYAVGRMPYPPGMASALRDELRLDGTGRLLDVGCGPGSLTLLLAPLFESAVGIDADAGMIGEAGRRGARAGIGNVEWRRMRAEDLPADLGAFRVVTFAQSFHWMDQDVVARNVRGMLDGDGVWVHVFATTHRGAAGPDRLPYPAPPWDRIDALVARYLGPVRRAGQGFLPTGTRSGEEHVMRRAGFTGPKVVEVRRAEVFTRSVDDIVAAVFSLSGSAPHLFGKRLAAFEDDLRRLLRTSSADGLFAERARDIAALIWRP
ncbi:MAG TPA: methyltransferase domain-containing protein [Pilimelia sp.]|nr:methyltransferase domain-containing protein [Pilimelia sp.]